MSFLRAQSQVDFRVAAGLKPPTATLSSKFSGGLRETGLPIPDILAPPDRLVSEKGQPGDVLSLQLLRRLSGTYCTSVTQQERSCFRHLNWSRPDIIERMSQSSARLHTTSTRCQNRSAPYCGRLYFAKLVFLWLISCVLIVK